MPKSLPPVLTPDERFKQVAVILAQGVLRFQRRSSSSASRPEIAPKFSPTGLEVSGKPRLSVPRRIGG
jgi:hypothetical protein